MFAIFRGMIVDLHVFVCLYISLYIHEHNNMRIFLCIIFLSVTSSNFIMYVRVSEYQFIFKTIFTVWIWAD